ncbi:HupE/UreJ family protein [Telluribacter sp. SYSU D00476]|uniref:HupE/UreJ family protein n=1 Tax=Telluribacter sp. SYSU D00476 TaxID=2811430 RepID=UPI001FF6C934|nr:HupE/UreJ family protein [Telluribacter sp. SYSU D00476]
MSEFQAYLQLGFEHITDPNGYDHILFVIALCAIYTLRDWKKVLILVTAFTIGHSVTLALATLNIINVRSDVIELLIPITILFTACMNFTHQTPKTTLSIREKSSPLRYPMALLFGLIHGLGFSTYLRSLLGSEASIVEPLLAFNVGLELGQILIVFVVLIIAFAIVELFRSSKHNWNYILSGIIAGMAISLIINNELFRELTGLPVE